MSRRANGEGSIFRRQDGRWAASLYVVTTRGRRKRVTVYGVRGRRGTASQPESPGKTRAEVREKMIALQGDVDRGVRMPEEKWTVAAYLGHWLEDVVRPNKAPKTYQGYELVVRLHIAPVIGRKRLRSLGVADVRDLIASSRSRE